MRRIIFLNRYFYPDQSATARMLTDLAFHLATLDNFDVHVVCSRQLYENAAAQLTREQHEQGVHVHRIWTTSQGRKNLIGRALDYVTFYFSTFVWLMRNCGPDCIVVAKTDPPLISVVAHFVTRSKGARLVNWLQDIFPEAARALEVPFVRSSVFSMLRRFRNNSLRGADVNVAIGEIMADFCRKQVADAARVVTIPNWIDGTSVQPIPHAENDLRRIWGLDKSFVIGYSGNLGRAHDFVTLVEAADELRDIDDLRFLFIGGGANFAKLKRECDRRALANVVFQPYQPESILSQSLSASDVHIISLLPALEGLIVPSKFYGICAVGRPIIMLGAEDGEIGRLICKHSCGYTLPSTIDSGAALARLIRDIRKDASDLKVRGERARLLLDGEFGRLRSLTSWSRILTGL